MILRVISANTTIPVTKISIYCLFSLFSLLIDFAIVRLEFCNSFKVSLSAVAPVGPAGPVGPIIPVAVSSATSSIKILEAAANGI